MSKHALRLASGESPLERSFEWLRDRVGRLEPAVGPQSRDVVWVDESHAVAVARDHRGQLEVFVVGDQLVPHVPAVRECLEYQRWATTSGEELNANRVVLPSAPHFDAVTALICVELIDNGLHSDPQAAFGRTEPVIALALRRAAMGHEALLGLAGELVFLSALTRAASPLAASALVEGWKGSRPSTRDFQLGPVGVEVKTTTGPASEHYIHGVRQVELGVPVDGVPETSLFLMSLGIRWLDGSSAGFRIPELVDSVLSQLPDASAAERFLTEVRQYGGDVALGYDHEVHRTASRFRRPFEVRFERLYDMTDDAIQVLRSSDLDGLVHLEQNSVTFRVSLPVQVRGDINPVTGMAAIVGRVLAKAGIPPTSSGERPPQV